MCTLWQGELSCGPLRRTHYILTWYYGALDRPAPNQGHPSEIVRCRTSSRLFFLPSFLSLSPPVAIRTCPSPRTSRPSPLARLDYSDRHRALQRRRVHRKYFRLFRDRRGRGEQCRSSGDEKVRPSTLRTFGSFLTSAVHTRVQMLQSLRDAVPLVTQAIASSITSPLDPGQLQSALKCFEAWIPNLPSRCVAPSVNPV